jgi:hypothetical protein
VWGVYNIVPKTCCNINSYLWCFQKKIIYIYIYFLYFCSLCTNDTDSPENTNVKREVLICSECNMNAVRDNSLTFVRQNTKQTDEVTNPNTLDLTRGLYDFPTQRG